MAAPQGRHLPETGGLTPKSKIARLLAQTGDHGDFRLYGGTPRAGFKLS
jgi:hypothetical protein